MVGTTMLDPTIPLTTSEWEVIFFLLYLSVIPSQHLEMIECKLIGVYLHLTTFSDDHLCLWQCEKPSTGRQTHGD